MNGVSTSARPPSVSRFVDRAGYLAWATFEHPPGTPGADELSKFIDEVDRTALRGAETVAALRRGEFTPADIQITYLGQDQPSKAVQISTEATALFNREVEANRADHPRYLDALNVDFVVSNPDKGDRDVSYYADFIKNYVVEHKDAPLGFTFTGTYGTNKVTHDVDEYVGWLYEAAGKQAKLKLQASGNNS